MAKKIGIDALGFYTSHYYLDLAELAQARGVDIDKFHFGLGQLKMAVPAPDEDIVTMAANAAYQALSHVDSSKIDHILFATESGFDQSKSAGTYIQRLLNLPKQCRVIELKQACYSATAAIQMGVALVAQNPKSKILVVASDISRYGLGSSGESSQGCGAVAMVLSANPRILAIESGAGLYADEVMDFWRPNYLDEALVDGKYSALIYLRALIASWKNFSEKTGRVISDIDYFCYHAPFPKLVHKAHKQLLKKNNIKNVDEQTIENELVDALNYPRNIGNSYSAALYVSLVSLLDNSSEDLRGKRIGFYSYGSGCMAEYFSGIVQPKYKEVLDAGLHQDMLSRRQALTYQKYESFYNFALPKDGSDFKTTSHKAGRFHLSGIKNHQRQYEKIETVIPLRKVSNKNAQDERLIKTISPGKIILSGEHSVVYGCPALALAVNRHATTTITPQLSKMFSLNLFSSRYMDSVTIKTLREVKDRLASKYQSFLDGKCGIKDVLQTPFELTEFVLINFMDRVNTKILDGLNIHSDSNIPIGCGMGSSAALILTILLAVSRFLRMPLNEEKLLRLAIEAENLQHGKSSGIDLHTSLNGGCVYFKEGQRYNRAIPKIPMFVINTGTPISTTGDCVSTVKQQHANSNIWSDFNSVTLNMDHALQYDNFEEFQRLVRENHQLLVDIGVVPEKVQRFISDVEATGAAAKICGSGAVTGDSSGIVLACAESEKQIQLICDRYGYALTEVCGEPQGLHVAC